MTDSNNPLLKARNAAETSSPDYQERNRQWWERLPMTYAEWGADDRMPETSEDFQQVEQTVFGTSPFLREHFDFTQAKAKKMLEIGCGTGVLTCRFARAGADVTAIDITETAVSMARRNAEFQGLSVEVRHADAEHLDIADNTFDYIFSWGVLHHTNDMNQAFREVSRILKPGGRGLAMVYYRTSVAYYIHGLYWLLIKGKLFQGDTIHNVQRHYTDGYHHRYLTKTDMKSLLDSVGLTTQTLTITQYQKKILPLIPRVLDEYLKDRFGMCLIAEFEKPQS